MKYICPVCGWNGLSREAYINGSQSYEICLCCDFQYGYDDDKGFTHEEWREKWIKEGMKWDWGRKKPPEGWNPEKQLLNIGVKV